MRDLSSNELNKVSGGWGGGRYNYGGGYNCQPVYYQPIYCQPVICEPVYMPQEDCKTEYTPPMDDCETGDTPEPTKRLPN